MATEQIVALELSTMAVLYRHPLDAEYELPLLVEKWTDLCADIPDEDFSAACKLYQQKEKFFPCPASIISVYEASRPAQSMAALPEPPYDKTPGLGMLCFAALRGDPAAKDELDKIRHQRGRNMQ